MHILHVTRETVSDVRYGIRKSLTPVIDALRQRGHQVELLDMAAAGSVSVTRVESWVEGVLFAGIRKRLGRDGKMAADVLLERVAVAGRAAKYAAKRKVSHVHCHDPLLGYYYRRFASLYGASTCWGYSAHAFGRFAKLRIGIETSTSSLAILQKMEDKAMKCARWVIVPTKSGSDQMIEDLGLGKKPGNWHVVPHAVTMSKDSRKAARQRIGVKEGEKLLVAAGQLLPMKRFDLLLNAVALIPASQQPRIILLGEGPEQQNLLQLANRLSMGDRYETRTTDTIGEFFAAADIYVSVSSTESFGMANCEAVLAGVPSVCSSVDAVPERIKEGAMLVGDDPKEIAVAIQKVLTSEEVRNALVCGARRITAGWPSPDAVACMLEEIYRRCAVSV